MSPQPAENRPGWAVVTEEPNPNFPALLALASANYERQTNWFLRHRDTGIRNLATIIASQSALVGLYFTTSTGRTVPRMYVCGLLILLTVLAAIVTWTAVKSCRNAYRAALESTLLIAKAVWGMGLYSTACVARSIGGPGSCPTPKDDHLYAWRWLIDTNKYDTEDDYLSANLCSRKNTYFLAKLTVVCLSGGAILIGFAAISTILGWL